MDEMQNDTPNEAENDKDGDSQNGGRTRSTIAFPYTPLRDAELVVTNLSQSLPGYASPDQLAGVMGQRPTSGTFRTRVATARIFGAVNVSRGRVELTDLGKRLADPQQRDQARVDAFLHVPLFKAIYENHIGATLPNDDGLEREIVGLGVSEKQADRARQAFQRSAEQAGFFKTAKDRLIMPALVGKPAEEKPKVQQPLTEAPMTVDSAAWHTLLLAEGSGWTADEVKAYVDAARIQWEIRRRKRA